MQTEFKNLFILPATMNLAGAELELAETDERYTALKKGLHRLLQNLIIL